MRSLVGCISNHDLTMMMTWQPDVDRVHFQLTAYIGPGDLYVAMGLSHDEMMGLFNKTGRFENGTIMCSFTRMTSANTDGKSHSLRLPWHVLLVWGQVTPGTDMKLQHQYVSASPAKVDLQAIGSYETEECSLTPVKMHGSVMMVAWVMLTSVGIIIARYFKGLLPESSLLGQKIWFQIPLVTLFFGLKLKKAAASHQMLYVLGGFLVWHVVLEVVFFLQVFGLKKKGKRRDFEVPTIDQEQKHEQQQQQPKPQKVSGLQEVLLMMHCAVAMAATILLIALFWTR
nr:hypothetical protein BaRGS_020322 [Batillaria attramentaria]